MRQRVGPAALRDGAGAAAGLGEGAMAKTVLTIDDSSSVRLMVKMTLKGAGYDVDDAADGAQGLKAATARAYDAIITDINMPVMDGVEFIRRFRATPQGKGVPLVVLTTESDAGLKQQAREAGAMGWLMKPFKQEQLVSVVQKVAGA